MAIDTIKFKRGTKNKLDKLSYGEPAYISDEGELYIGTESGVEKITSNKEVKELSSQLAENTSRVEGFVNAKEFGMSEDNEDNTAILQELVDNASTIIIPKGTYKFKSGITISNPIEIDGNNCDFIFEGEGSFITLMSNNLIFNRITIQSSKGRDSETLQVCFDAGDVDKVNRQIRFNYINVSGFSDSAFLLNSQWHITLKHCTIGKCGAFNVDNSTGGIVIRGEQITPSWNGSGNIIEDCYISGCNYGLYGGGGWNVQLNNVIFEYNNYPIRKGVGRYIGTNRCWFEGNLHGCYGGGINSVGDRQFGVETDTINEIYEIYGKPGSEGVYGADNNPYFEMKDGKITKFTLHTDSGVRTAFDKNGTQHLTISKGTVIAGEGGGTVNAGKPAHENSILRLAGYGGYWATTVEKWNTPLCALDLNYTSSNVGDGRGSGGFDFKASQVNGSAVSRELLSVFGVNSNGTISPMQLDGTADIGTKTAKYNDIYCNAMVLCSPNGTFFKVTVNDDGALNTTKI